MTDTAKICAALRTPCNSCAWHEEPADRCETCRLLAAVAEVVEAAGLLLEHTRLPAFNEATRRLRQRNLDEAIRRAKEVCQ